MQDPSDKPDNFTSSTGYMEKAQNPRKLARSRRRAAHVKNTRGDTAESPQSVPLLDLSPAVIQGYDPEFLYVECGRCGAPVIWEEGRASKLLLEAGVDPLELDASCLLLTDGCPACGSSREYSVRIFRLSDQGATHIVPLHGHA